MNYRTPKGGAVADRDFEQRMQRVEGLLARVERFDDDDRETTRALVQALMDLHGAALGKMLDMTLAAGPPGKALLDAFAGEGLVASLLLLYGLHPLDARTRVEAALEAVRLHLRSHNAEVEFLDLSEGVLRLRLVGASDCSTRELAQAVEEAITAAAPDLAAVHIEGDPGNGRIPLPMLGARP
jgi:hypothetical protein